MEHIFHHSHMAMVLKHQWKEMKSSQILLGVQVLFGCQQTDGWQISHSLGTRLQSVVSEEPHSSH